MRKILYFDTETTGLDPKVHCIHQAAGIIEIDGKIVDKFSLSLRPVSTIHETAALNKCRKTWDELIVYPPQEEAFAEMIMTLKKHLRGDDKFTLIGYNVKFDEEFLRVWLKNNFTEFYQWFWTPSICVMTLAGEALHEIRPSLKNFRQDTVAAAMEQIMRPGEEPMFCSEKAHDALYDVVMCRFIYKSSLKILAAK